MSERNTYWENQIKAFKQFQREIEGSTSSTAHTTYWLTGWDMGVKENQKKISDLEDDLNVAIDEVKDKDKRIAELEEEIKESRGLVSKLVYILQRSKPESYVDTTYFKNTLDAGCDYMRGENINQSEGDVDVEVTKYKLFGLTVGTRRHISEGGADDI